MCAANKELIVEEPERNNRVKRKRRIVDQRDAKVAPSAYCPGSAAIRKVSTRSSDTRMISSRPAARPYDVGG